jgi:hypothetical protein
VHDLRTRAVFFVEQSHAEAPFARQI